MGVAFGCVGNTIRLRSGRYLDLSNPTAEQFTLEDIAGGLSKICRFGGQIERFYSVAEHSVMCEWQSRLDGLPRGVQLACLFHDAAEAFIGDVVKPLKLMLRDFGEIEERIEFVIGQKFGVDFVGTKADVRKIDHEMLIAERRAMFSADDVQWTGEKYVRRLDLFFNAWPSEQAEVQFLNVARRLLRKGGGS